MGRAGPPPDGNQMGCRDFFGKASALVAAALGWIGKTTMSISRNILFLMLGALIAGVSVLGYALYQEKKEPNLQIKLGPLKIEQK